jgi:DNA mismatch endonuclease (patch repair protein)
MPASAATTNVMKANPRTDTGPETRVRSLLHRAGFRFRKDYRIATESVRTHADIAFPGQKIAVFIDGCFWHACPQHRTKPKHNAWYWTPKLRRNRARDRTVTRRLVSLGWIVMRFWEHVPPTTVAKAVRKRLPRG